MLKRDSIQTKGLILKCGRIKSILLATLCLLLMTEIHATESGSLALRGHRQYNSGNIQQSYLLMERSLRAAYKEGDLRAQARSLINLASLEIFARRFDVADSLLNTVETPQISPKIRNLLALTRITLENERNQFAQAWETFEKVRSGFSADDLEENFRIISIYMEAAVAAAALKNGEAENLLSQVRKQNKQIHKGITGRLMYTEARVALAQGNTRSALEYLQQALSQAQQSGRNWYIGKILYLTGVAQQAEKNSSAAQEAFQRSLRVYGEMGLILPYLQAADRYLQLNPDDAEVSRKVAEVRKQFGVN